MSIPSGTYQPANPTVMKEPQVATAAYYTLGCKVNQYETETIRGQMEAHGFRTVPFSTPADVYVINTCTVTGAADSKSRHAVRQASRRNPEAFVVVTGCYAELEPDAVAELPGVDAIVANSEKDDIVRRALARIPSSDNMAALSPTPRTRTRAILKVQDGCDQFCSYCAVPYARTGKKSRPLEDVLREASSLASFGYKEVVLTGIRLGSYCDSASEPEADVAVLARRISRIDGLARIRLSSIEAWEITDALIQTIRDNSGICPHLHIPLQSGDDGVLKRMGRPYDTGAYKAVVDKIRKVLPNAAITTDILVGFPGETDEEFNNTMRFVEETAFSRAHVFRYSPRPMTRAAAMEEHVPEEVKEERSRRMIELTDRLALQYAEAHIGQVIEVLAERKRASSGLLSGYTEDYVETEFEGPSSLAGQLIRVEALSASEGRLRGRLLTDR